MLLLLCLPFAFWACGDDSSAGREATESKDDSTSRVISSEVERSVDYVWETADDKVKCKNTRSGKTAYYEPDDAVLICEYDEDSDEWIWTEYVDDGNEDDDPDIRQGDDEDTGSKSNSSSSVIPSNVEGSSDSKNLKTAWDYLNPDIDYGEFTDERDGQVYKTVKIGSQTWMAENLNYAYNERTAKSYCYNNYYNNYFNNSADSCAKYGRLYLWSAAMDSAAVFSDGGKGCGVGKTCRPSGIVRGVCPEGWHLPSYDEWNALHTAVGGPSIAGTMLKSQTGWTMYSGILAGSDAYGFSALPAGSRSNDGYFYSAGNYAIFWSSCEYNRFGAYRMNLYDASEDAYLDYYYAKNTAFSVRCLKD